LAGQASEGSQSLETVSPYRRSRLFDLGSILSILSS